MQIVKRQDMKHLPLNLQWFVLDTKKEKEIPVKETQVCKKIHWTFVVLDLFIGSKISIFIGAIHPCIEYWSTQYVHYNKRIEYYQSPLHMKSSFGLDLHYHYQ